MLLIISVIIKTIIIFINIITTINIIRRSINFTDKSKDLGSGYRHFTQQIELLDTMRIFESPNIMSLIFISITHKVGFQTNVHD